jgi:hypothetical protein
MFEAVMQWTDIYGQSIHNGAVVGALVALFLAGRSFVRWMGTTDGRVQWLKDEMDELDLSVSVQVQSLSSRVSMLEQASRDRANRDRLAAASKVKPKVLAIKKAS